MKFKVKIDWRYSIREIFLIVISISIAFILNNWNQKRQRQQEEKLLLIEFRNTLKNDLNDIDANLFQYSTSVNSAYKIIEAIDKNLPYYDSLSFHFSTQPINTLFWRNEGPYEVLKSKGFDLISNQNLRKEIIHLYSVQYHVIDNIELNLPQFKSFEPLFEYIRRNFKKSSKANFSEYYAISVEPVNYEKLKQDLEFRILIENVLFWRNAKIALYNETKSSIEKMLTLIENEI